MPHGDQDAFVAPIDADKLIAARLANGDIVGRDRHTITSGDTGRPYRRAVYNDADDAPVTESWTVRGGGHAWGVRRKPRGLQYGLPGPRRVAEMIRFFLLQQLPSD